MKNTITSRLQTFLAKIAGKNASVSTLTPPVPINLDEQLMLDIADRIDAIEEGGGGGGLPEVTDDNNGDVLTVVDGAWSAITPGTIFDQTVTIPSDATDLIQIDVPSTNLDVSRWHATVNGVELHPGSSAEYVEAQIDEDHYAVIGVVEGNAAFAVYSISESYSVVPGDYDVKIIDADTDDIVIVDFKSPIYGEISYSGDLSGADLYSLLSTKKVVGRWIQGEGNEVSWSTQIHTAVSQGGPYAIDFVFYNCFANNSSLLSTGVKVTDVQIAWNSATIRRIQTGTVAITDVSEQNM